MYRQKKVFDIDHKDLKDSIFGIKEEKKARLVSKLIKRSECR